MELVWTFNFPGVPPAPLLNHKLDSPGVQKILAANWKRYWGDGAVSGSYKLFCECCGRLFYARRRDAKYCGRRCGIQANMKARQVRREEARQKTCNRCGVAFSARRSDALFCSGTCRQAAHRQNERRSAPARIRDK